MILQLFFLLLFLCVCLESRRRSTRKLPPGPKGLPILGYLPFLARSPTQKITQLSKEYGNIFTMKLGSQLVLFVNDVPTMKEMGRMDVFQGRNQLEIIRPLRENRGLIFLEGQGWSEWRRFTLQTLKNMGFGGRTMERLILDELQDLIGFLQKNKQKPLYLKDFTDIVSVNGLWEILAGEKFDLEDEEKHRVLKIIEEGIADQAMLGFVTFLPKLAQLFPSVSGWNRATKCFGSPFKLIQETLDKHVEAYRMSNGREKDFIDIALTKIYSTTDPSSCFYKQTGMENLFFTILDLFVTGSDTVSSTIAWAFLLVAIHPQVQSKIHHEIDQVIGSTLPSISDKAKMIYTEATMMEVLRRSSIVPFGAMHTALEDVEDFHGYFIPKRTVILWNLYHVHHDPSHWRDPENFRPERFINPDRTLRRDDHLIPFFTGKRSCPAESVALNEFFLFFVGVLQKFELHLANPEMPLDLGPKPGFCASPPRHHILLKQRMQKMIA